jgi:aminoglycoside phosphotransferase (APT) family kinase protein
MMTGAPLADVDSDLICKLLREQHTDLALLPIDLMDAGWDNFMFRLGDTYTVRMPRRLPVVSLLINEQEWLPALASNLPSPVPSPLRIGHPGHSFVELVVCIRGIERQRDVSVPPFRKGKRIIDDIAAQLAVNHQVSNTRLRNSRRSSRKQRIAQTSWVLSGRLPSAILSAFHWQRCVRRDQGQIILCE